MDGHTFHSSCRGNATSYRENFNHSRNVSVATPKSEWLSETGLLEPSPRLQPSSIKDDFRLYRLFTKYMGCTQHFLDDRQFTDSLTLFSRSLEARLRLLGSLWYIEYLLVLSIGKLLDDDPGSARPPGIDYFSEALRRLPPLHELGAAGSVAVEILALTATYLQWIGKSHDAYLYVSQRCGRTMFRC